MSSKKSLKSSTNGNGASNNKNVTNNDNQTTSERPNYNYDSYSISSSSQTSLKGGFSTLVGGFGGYHGTASSETFSFDHSQQLDPQIEFCLKRLLKKDSITKLKAFGDLSKLFATLSIDKLEACASAWAYAFNKLALVNDKRIRENLHLCFAPFCKQISSAKVKWFTPHLKRIFCYWFIHQHDTSPEVVEAAYNSFYNAFGTNSNRHWKVISYVKHCMLNEMQYILDTNTTPQTLSNHIKRTNTKSKKQKQKHKKSSSSKQDTERYQRVIASTLCGLATLIAKENEIESTNINKIKQQEDWFQTYRQLLCNTNIWRFINDPCPLLRNSAYLLCSACLGNGNVAKHILPLISSTLFRCMSDSYMPNMDNLWTSLLAMIQYKDCWKYAKKKSFIIRLSNIVRVDIFTACKYIRSFLLYIPSNYLFELSLGLNTGHDNEDDDGMKKKKKKSKKNRHKHNDENDGLYPICKVLKCIWLGALNISHLSKRFKAVTIIYFKLILQMLLRDNNAKCDDNEYIHDKDKDMININKLCKDMIIKENVINLICKSLKELDCPSLFFELLGEHFLPKIVEYDDELLRDYAHDMPHDEMDKIVAKMEVIRQNEYYNNIIVETVNCIFSSIQSEFIEPFGDLMTLVMDENVTDDDEQQEIADKTDDFVSDYNTGLNKLSSFVLHLKPFICIENILYQANDAKADEDDDSDDNITYWNRRTSVKLCLYELMNEIWNFQSNIELIVDMTDPQIIIAQDENNNDNDSDNNNNNMIDSDSEIEDDDVEYDDDIKIDFNKLFVSNPNAMSYSVCNTSLKIVKNMIEILSIDFGQMSSNKFKLDLFLNNEITQTIQYILSTLQSKIPMQYSSGIMQILLQIINLILNQDKNNPMQYKYDTTKHWKSFLQSVAMTNYDWSLKNMSLFIDNIFFENIESNNKEYGLESFLIDWLSQYLNSNLPNVSNTIPAEAYTSLIISLQKLLSQANNTYLLPILKLICNYLDKAIEIGNNPENKVSYPGITKNKTHCIIRSLSRFLEQNWRNNTDENKMDENKELEYNKLSEYQLLIVSKLFTLCFARNDRDDPQNIATICEYMFKKIIRYHTTDLYGELLEVIAKSLRLPFYFTTNPMNTNKDIPKYYYPSFIKQEIPIIINRYNPSRWRWCVQCLLLLQSTTFQHGLHLINIILSRKDLEYIFSLALCDKSEKSEKSLNKLSAFGVTLSTLQRCRDVICDLSDLIGMELVLYKPSENSHFSELSLQEIELCDREWLICWLLSFEEKLSWLPVSTLPDPSIIQHTKQCSTESVRHLFAKPRIFSCVLYSKLIMQMLLQYEKNIKNERNPQQLKHKKIFVIPQTFVDNIIMHAADPNNSSLYFKQCPVAIRSRVIGYFVNILNDRMSIYNYHAVRYLDNGLRSFVSSLFTNHSKDKDIQTIIDNIQTMQSVFVMFPDFIPISFIRFIIAESTKCREKISNLTGQADGKQIIKELRLLHHLLRPIHCIALNITCEYKTPSYDTDNICNKTSTNYPTSIIWDKHRELLVGTLFELFLYVNGSFESYLQQMEEKEEIEENNDIYFWFSSCLTVISHALIGMNSEGEKDVFFELDWSSFIFVSNFVMNHILHERSEFTLCLHSYLSQFYQFLLIYSKPNINHNVKNENNENNENDITILNNIDQEYRYNMMTLWHCMAVLRQIALRSTDLSGRKNLKTKKNKSFIFESLELLTEILGNEIWRNILSSEALASPFHKLSLKELGAEQSISSQTQSQFMLHSGFMAKSLSGIEEAQNQISYVNMTPSYQIHAILDELYHSINDLLNHPIIMSDNNKLHINKSLSSILETWHYQLFDALGSSHHQIVASAFRILSISTPFHVLQNIHLFKQSTIAIKDDLKQNEYSDSDVDDGDDEVSVVSSTSYAASVAFSMSDQYTNNKNKNTNKRIHSIINRIIPIMYLLPHNTRSLTASHELRSYFLSWYLFMNMIEQCPLEFRLEIVSVMKHDNKYTSPLGSYSLALREIIEHVYIAPSLQLLMDDFINKFCIIGSPNKFPFDLDDFCSNVPSDDPNICANMLSRCKWLHNNGIYNADMKHNTNIFFSNLAIRVYDRLLSYFPALCRYWAINDVKDRVTRNIVSKITSSQFSPIILKNIFNTKKLNRTLKILRQENDIKLSDDIILKLKCNLQTREIEAIYLCQEISISVIILYPFDYPLKGLSFQWKQTCGLPPKKTKNWQLLLMGMLNHQNATIVEAFLLLSINISKHYQGIDECPICYSVVHPTKKTLPKVKCLTCKGKFHRYCIYKWTKTSQKSTCPLCRSLI